MGGISNSSSPKLGVWKVYEEKEEQRRKIMKHENRQEAFGEAGLI